MNNLYMVIYHIHCKVVTPVLIFATIPVSIFELSV